MEGGYRARAFVEVMDINYSSRTVLTRLWMIDQCTVQLNCSATNERLHTAFLLHERDVLDACSGVGLRVILVSKALCLIRVCLLSKL